MKPKYPNLELLEYICEKEVRNLYNDALKGTKWLVFRSFVFPQTWPSTAKGMDAQGGFSGQAFTEAYTSIFEVSWYLTDETHKFEMPNDRIYAVFFDDSLAYVFMNPNDKFFEDMKNLYMVSQKEALGRYI